MELAEDLMTASFSSGGRTQTFVPTEVGIMSPARYSIFFSPRANQNTFLH